MEAKEGANWVFRNWHALPASADCSDSDALKAAVADYEEARGGNGSLRSALTGIPPGARQASDQAGEGRDRACQAATRRISMRAKKSSGYYGFRAPLRPPLLTPAVTSLRPNAPGN